MKKKIKKGALSFPSEQAINWRSFKKLAIEAYGETESDFTFEKCLEIIQIFFYLLPTMYWKSSPAIKKRTDNQYHGKNALHYIGSTRGFDTEPENYTVLIDKYFETPFSNCDYRINHFFSGDIRTNRFYEELY